MPRFLKAFVGLSLTATGASAMPLAPMPGISAPTRIEYFCSDGFAPRGGRCVATASRDEIELFFNDAYPVDLPRRHRKFRHALRELF